jgi:hypothetical protein
MKKKDDGQPEFDFTPHPRKLARKTDPSTSKRSAKRVSEFSGEHHRRILEALGEMVDGTAYDIAEETGMGSDAVFRRLNELEKGKVIFLTGKERPGPTGRMCRVWTANAADAAPAAPVIKDDPPPAPNLIKFAQI